MLGLVFSPLEWPEMFIIILCMISIICCFVLRYWNPIHYQYVSLLNSKVLLAAVIYLSLLLIAAAHLRSFVPKRISALIIILFLTLLPLTAGFMGQGPILLTPFHLVDRNIMQFDKMLGVDVGAVMNFAYQSPLLVKILKFCYFSLYPFQIILIPLLLVIIGHFRQAQRMIVAVSMGSIVAGLIYYFFPTTGPASVIPNHHYVQSSYQLVQRFISIHRNQFPKSLGAVGLIAFPSCHVLIATILTLFTARIKFIGPCIVVLNVLLVFATMALGYHFFADVLAGIVLAVLFYWLSGKIQNWSVKPKLEGG